VLNPSYIPLFERFLVSAVPLAPPVNLAAEANSLLRIERLDTTNWAFAHSLFNARLPL
jgi:hypothetical protein